jgi:hypothetical protein
MTDRELMDKAWDYLASYTVGERPNASEVNDFIAVIEDRMNQPEQELMIDCPRCGHCCPQPEPLYSAPDDKVVRDGKVAVLTSPSHGAGWYSWHNVPELVFDPAIVNMVDKGADYMEIIQYCEKQFPSIAHCYAGAEELTIIWIQEGREFVINEYGGLEIVEFKEDMTWLVA